MKLTLHTHLPDIGTRARMLATGMAHGMEASDLRLETRDDFNMLGERQEIEGRDRG